MFWGRVNTLHRARVGDMRAARIAGMRPAITPMSRVAASPPAHAVVGMTMAQGEQCRFGEELDPDVSLGGPERAPEPDLGAAFENRDDHDVGDSHRADQERDRAEAQEQPVEGALGLGPGDERVRRPAEGDVAG